MKSTIIILRNNSLALTRLGLIALLPLFLIFPEATSGQGVEERVVECMCKQREGNQNGRLVGLCTGHYMGYQEECGNDKSCLANKMNNGLERNRVNASLCK